MTLIQLCRPICNVHCHIGLIGFKIFYNYIIILKIWNCGYHYWQKHFFISHTYKTDHGHIFIKVKKKIQHHQNKVIKSNLWNLESLLLRMPPGTSGVSKDVPVSFKLKLGGLARWYGVDVLCRQQIKLFRVVFTSEFNEYQWNNVVFIFLSPRVSEGPQKPQTLTASKTKYEKFGPKI